MDEQQTTSETATGGDLALPEIVASAPAPRLKTLSNGAIMDLDRGRIVDGSQITTKITPENAIEYNRKRRELAKKAVQAGIMEGTGAPSVFGGVKLMSAAMAELAVKGKGNASVKAYSEVMRMSGLAPADSRREENNQPGITISESALVELRKIIEMYR